MEGGVAQSKSGDQPAADLRQKRGRIRAGEEMIAKEEM
jgi:hypothetical protein